MKSPDLLAHMSELPGVLEASEAARTQVDQLLWHKKLRGRTAEFAAESALRGAVANSEMEGAGARLEAVRSGAALDDSPVGRALAGSVRLSAEVPHLVDLVLTAPRQALARMHAVAAAGIAAEAALGRPRAAGETPDDPLRLGPVPPAAEVAHRLDMLAELLAAETAAPALVVAGIVHAEVAVLRPFGWGSGIVARALPRLVLAAKGVDPGMLSIPEGGLMALGRPAYVAALRGYQSGSPTGVAEWLVHSAASVGRGAEASMQIAEAYV